MRDTKRGHMPIKMRLLACAAFGVIAATAMPGTAYSQSEDAALTVQHDFNLPAQPLSRTITQVASIAGLQVLYSDDMAADIQAPAIRGRMSAQQALERLLAGSGFAMRYTSDKVVTLVKVPGGNDGELVTGAVRVEGAQGSPYFGGAGQAAGVNGVNGSRDITATEGTGSFTSGALTIGSKVPQALKDVPQSISVLTSERLEQQNVTDFTAAMKQLPGVTLVQGSSTFENTFYSRGFAINNIQIDGGAPLVSILAGGGTFGYYPQIDMAQYDHVELLRGAAGLFNGYGDASGSVNLVRKKPLDHAQFSLEAQIGSWSNYRLVLDASSPLALEGRLRGRLVTTYQDNHYFYDLAKDKKSLIYGVAELDITPTTLATAGINYTRQDSLPWYNGLPRYATGADLELPRSTSFVFPWNRWNFETTEFFGSIEQKIGEEWTGKINLTHNRQSSTQKVGYGSGAINPFNNSGRFLTGIYNDYRSKQFSAEMVLTGAFELFGQRQEITVGANRVTSGGAGGASYNSLIYTYLVPYQPYPGGPIYCQDYGSGECPPGSIPANGPKINVFDFDPRNPIYSEPGNPLPSAIYRELGQTQSGAYVNLRLTAFEKLHLTTGIRWSRYSSKFAYDQYCTNTLYACEGMAIGDIYRTVDQSYKGTDFSWPPAVNLSFDVTKDIAAYVGYTDIYRNQANLLKADRTPIGPITGANWEAGVKWAARNGRFNLSFAAYRMTQKGFDLFDDSEPYEQVAPGVYCCFVSDPDRTQKSEGLEIEATGEILPGWQVASSYTYSVTKQEGSYYGGGEGQPFTSIQPKQLYKIWMSYDFGASGRGGALSGLAISGGINGQSSAYYSGYLCVNLNAPDPVSGLSNCVSYAAPDYVEYDFTVPAYAVVSARIDYRLSPVWSLAVNLENILDKTYYQAVGGGVSGGDWYGTPRSYTATLRAKW